MKRLFCLLLLQLLFILSCKSADIALQNNKIQITEYGSETKNEQPDEKSENKTGDKKYITKADEPKSRSDYRKPAPHLTKKSEKHSQSKNKEDGLPPIKNKPNNTGFKVQTSMNTKRVMQPEKKTVKHKKKVADTSNRDTKAMMDNWLKEGYYHLAQKEYRKAAECFLNAEKPLLSRDAYISGAENALKQKEPNYNYAMENYQMAGFEERGKKHVVTVMINHLQISEAFKLAKSISPKVYSEALLTAGDVYLSRDIETSIGFYKASGLENYQCRIGDFFLKGKKPDFGNAELWFSKSTDPTCHSRLLLKALQINDTARIRKYSGGSKDKNALNKIAENAESEKQYMIAAIYYEKAGKHDKADYFWKISIKNSIENKMFYQDYVNIFVHCKPHIKALFWETVQSVIKNEQRQDKQSVANMLLKFRPELALAYLSNHQMYISLKNRENAVLVNQTHAKPVRSKPYSVFNTLLEDISEKQFFFSDKLFEEGFTYLEIAQKHLNDERFPEFYHNIDLAKNIFINK